LLQLDHIDRHGNFFELGGDSLLAVRLILRVRQALGVEVALSALFAQPVFADFVRGLASVVTTTFSAIMPVEGPERLALSFAQQRLWFLAQLDQKQSQAYHVPFVLRLSGRLDEKALVKSLDRLVARHEVLRTTFIAIDGEPVQRIMPEEESHFHLVEDDLRGQVNVEAELERLAVEETNAPLDLRHGPLIRGRLIRTEEEEHTLLITMHHIVCDGWSMGVLFRDLSALYEAYQQGEADPLPTLPVQYADYAAWQRRCLAGAVLQEQAEYWKVALAGAPALLELPTDRSRPVRQDFAGGIVACSLNEELTTALKALSQRHGTTLFVTLLAGWAVLLARLSGQPEVVIGTPSANRNRREIEELIGFFVNTLALRVDVSGSPTVGELLERVKAVALDAQQHQDIPFEQVVEIVRPERSLAHSPLFQVMFAWQNSTDRTLELPGLTLGTLQPAAPRTTARFDLSLSLMEAGERIEGGAEYATALFDRSTVERYVGHWRTLLQAMVADDHQTVDHLPLLSEAEHHQILVEWNPTEEAYPSEKCIHDLFEEQVEKNSEAVALVYEGQQVTYGELNAQANQLSHYLREIGVRPDERVAVCVERGFKMIVGLLAVLKAGGAYVPLDPTYPIERLNYMLTDSEPVALLTERKAREILRDLPVTLPVLDLSAPTPPWSNYPTTNSQSNQAGLTSNHLAYVIYTSGSTGLPKGVMISTGALAEHICSCLAYYEITAADTILQFAPISFDVSIEQTFCALASGATLLIRGAQVTEYLDVTVAGFTPSYFQTTLETNSLTLPALRLLLLGGEPLPAALLSRWTKDCVALHAYGPTETTITATHYDLRTHDVRSLGTRDYLPIGRPLASKRIYILDELGQPVPIGVTGELHIGGAGVARGYLNQPELTAQKFVRDPFSTESGARMYKSGDLGRWLPDGNIEFLGRNDFQVKIRGFRIELGEIEARLMEHAAVREAVVMAREDTPGEKRLVAYYVGEKEAEEVKVEELRGHLSLHLPDYMVPAAYVRLEALPLTPNRKLDRQALPAPDVLGYGAREYEPPRGEVETTLADIWAEVLKLERVGRHDNFFELGGHSLLAVRMISRVRPALGVEVALSALFAQPVLADFACSLANAASTTLPIIGCAEPNERRALSFAQQRLWFLAQMGEEVSAAYHIPAGLRLSGVLDHDALRCALDRIVMRHEALRTSFTVIDGTPVQHIAPEAGSHFYLREHNLQGQADLTRGRERLIAEEATTPFDLEHGPLIRGRLIREGEQEHVLLITMHHIVSDAWSKGVWARELSALYEAYRCGEADPLPALEIQYADYAAWQRRWVSGDVLQQQAEYWKTTLAGAPALLELPTDHRRPAEQDYAGGFFAYGLDAELTQNLKALSQRHGVTLFMTLLSSWAVLLARLSSQEEVVIGTPTANRGRREIEGLIGFFVNTLVLRIDVSGSPTVGELLARVKEQALAAQQHQDIPFEQVVEIVRPARSLAHSPLFQVMFAWQNPTDGTLELPGLTLAPLAAVPRTTAKFDLSLSLTEVGERIEGGVEYATALFERSTVERYLGHWRTLLEAMVADDHQTVDRLAMLRADERRQVLEEWNDTEAEYAADRCIHELFEEQVAKTPEAVAVIYEDRRLTYGELNEQANRLAHYLRELGVRPDDRVAICLERSPEMVVALMAVLKAGGAYVPLDPAYPAERLAFMLQDSAPSVVLSHGQVREEVRALLADAGARLGVSLLDLSAPVSPWAEAHPINPLPATVGLTPSHLAYVIYTSGSTGKPKGVAMPHNGLVNLICWQLQQSAASLAWPTLQFAVLGFDVAFQEAFSTLCNGGTLVCIHESTRLNPIKLGRLIVAGGIKRLFLPHTALRFLVEGVGDTSLQVGQALREVIVAGEQLRVDPEISQFFAAAIGCTLQNQYGPAETHVVSAFDLPTHVMGWPQFPPIGRPIANTQIYVLDELGQPVPIGVTGELHIGGAGVARGYLNQPELTAQKFVRDPFSTESGARMYKSGDLGRWLPDGNIEFLGRNDFQVKIRGFRIELGEIEARLMEHAAVREAVVMAREDTPGEKRLVAYYVGEKEAEEVKVEELRGHLSLHLPDYMVPAAYVRLEALPLTPNRKLDRQALPAPDVLGYGAREYEPPRGEVETTLAGIWAEVLKLERVDRHDNFFEVGGHSLLAVRLVTRVQQAFGVAFTISELFSNATFASVAARIIDAQLSQFNSEDLTALLQA